MKIKILGLFLVVAVSLGLSGFSNNVSVSNSDFINTILSEQQKFVRLFKQQMPAKVTFKSGPKYEVDSNINYSKCSYILSPYVVKLKVNRSTSESTPVHDFAIYVRDSENNNVKFVKEIRVSRGQGLDKSIYLSNEEQIDFFNDGWKAGTIGLNMSNNYEDRDRFRRKVNYLTSFENYFGFFLDIKVFIKNATSWSENNKYKPNHLIDIETILPVKEIPFRKVTAKDALGEQGYDRVAVFTLENNKAVVKFKLYEKIEK